MVFDQICANKKLALHDKISNVCFRYLYEFVLYNVSDFLLTVLY